MPSRSATLPATPCPLWRRLLALLYDVLIVVALVMVVGLLSQLATGGQLVQGADHAQVPAWYRPLQALVVSAYFISSWMRGGQTVGMRPWRIRLSGRDGASLTLRQAVLRLLVAGVPLLLLMLTPTLGLRATLWALLLAWAAWFAPALLDPRRRTLHDIAAATELRRLD